MLRKILSGLAIVIGLGGAWLAVATTGFPSVLKPSQPDYSVVLLNNARLISMAPGSPEIELNRAVLIEEGVIQHIGKPGKLDAPKGALVIDVAGATLLPGLIDAHVHVWDEAELAGYLAHGVTGVRNLSGFPFHLPLSERIESGKILGPDFLTSGPILNSLGPNFNDLHVQVETAEEARKAVQDQYDDGYRLLKVYSNLKREPYDAIREEAQRLGMRIAGHTPEGWRAPGIPEDKPFEISFEESLDYNFQTIEHVESIFWHGLRDVLDEAAMRNLADRIAASGATVTPTLIAHDNLVRVARSKGAYLNRPGVDTINPVLRSFEQGTYDFWSAQDPDNREGPRAEFYLKTTRMLHEAGVPLVVGTDAGIFTNIPGSSIVREMELFVEAGISPYDTLVAATRNGAVAMGFEKTGVIAPGYVANLVLVEKDPLNDISVLETPDGVMIRGRWLDAQALEEMKEGARETSKYRTWRRLAEMMMNK